MYYHICGFLVLLLCGQLTAQNNDPTGAIGFPEAEEDQNLKNKDNRQPVFLPSSCPVNELYYPGDQKDDWICDCRPGSALMSHLYHPGSDMCWPAYQRGPCPTGEYLTLPSDTAIPVCTKNQCNDGAVMFNDKCERIGSITPCTHLFPVSAAVGVNAVNLAIECVRLNLETRFGDELIGKFGLCQPGSKSSVKGKCSKA
ncbi:hypothetical protein ACJJTC_013675 [Scirpophaga incertulas]